MAQAAKKLYIAMRIIAEPRCVEWWKGILLYLRHRVSLADVQAGVSYWFRSCFLDSGERPSSYTSDTLLSRNRYFEKAPEAAFFNAPIGISGYANR